MKTEETKAASGNDGIATPGASYAPTDCSAWIPCSEKLPALDTPVLVCEKNWDGILKITTIAEIRAAPAWSVSHKDEWCVVENCGGYECDPHDCIPVYWMPLPPLPNPSLHRTSEAQHNQKGSTE